MTISAYFNSRTQRAPGCIAYALEYAALLSLLVPQCFHGGWKRKRRPGGWRISLR